MQHLTETSISRVKAIREGGTMQITRKSTRYSIYLLCCYHIEGMRHLELYIKAPPIAYTWPPSCISAYNEPHLEFCLSISVQTTSAILNLPKRDDHHLEFIMISIFL